MGPWPEIHQMEKPLDWVFRKKRPTHFYDRQACQSDVRTNTEVLYDGSPQARAILGPTFEGDITEEGAGVRRHALDYLKGKDVEHMGMWTQYIFAAEPLEELEQLAISQMVMDRSAVVEEEPMLVQITPAESSYFEESVEQNKKLLERLGE